MFPKLFAVWLCLVLCDTGSAFRTNFSQIFNPTHVREKMTNCNQPQCSYPCTGAAPPPVCPTVLPNCTSDCACMADCERHAIYCFQIHLCHNLKRLYARVKNPKILY